MTGPRLFLVAGELSGDLLGARLMRAIKAKNSDVQFSGVGGPRMQAEGLQTLFPETDLAHVGIFEIARHVPLLLRRIRQVVQAVKRAQPDVFLSIDCPDFNFRVAKKIKACAPRVKLVHYVAPSVWAWRPGRAAAIARFLDHLLALLPFEPPYFEKVGLPCSFVGHPLVESGAGAGDGARLRAAAKWSADDKVLVVLPGSRLSEINRLMPVFEKAVAILAAQNPGLRVVLPVAPTVEPRVAALVQSWAVPVFLARGDAQKYDALAAGTAALACSGTVSIELALARLPAVIAYIVHPLTAAIGRRLIKTPYATLVNIMKNAPLMPEYIQENCTPEKLAAAVQAFLSDKDLRAAHSAQLGEMARWLGAGSFVPSERAAEVVLRVAEGETGKKE